MGNSALGRGTAVEEDKVKASSGDATPGFLDAKVDGTTMTVVADELVRSALTGDVTTVGNAATVVTNANLTGPVTSVGNATAIADKALAISKLADGTDGELITWDASGVIAAVPAGSATEVLTSNGAGAAPTFQAAAGGGALSFVQSGTAVNATSFTVTQTVGATETYLLVVEMDMTGGGNNLEPGIRINGNGSAVYDWVVHGMEGVNSFHDGVNDDNQIKILDDLNPNTLSSGIFRWQGWITARGGDTQIVFTTYSDQPNGNVIQANGAGSWVNGTMTSLSFITISGTETYNGDWYLYRLAKS